MSREGVLRRCDKNLGEDLERAVRAQPRLQAAADRTHAARFPSLLPPCGIGWSECGSTPLFVMVRRTRPAECVTSMERHQDADLVVVFLHMASTTHGGDVKGVIFHSNRGSEHASRRFHRACRRLGVTQSMGRVGSCIDNAVSEAFNSVLKVEYVHRHTFASAPRRV
ncbi:hypothetical protein K2224_27130 [Streptomyces sp. BHT-5-2]|uniref:DDE-type integrase/transposase/recombinase n=1 Tax=Streptomyces sp. BHT-5-2 TaxID=2866715 RepID=UPI001C8DB5A1|nr:DDE-type integrase/transposase/recombinase [Streptomyces sp. BHT-5-2]QZL06389.1 hypothetical protein K2224_27130 [Streptomyces sp. BHT-5-2]